MIMMVWLKSNMNPPKYRTRLDGAFSLVELLVSIAVISILAGLSAQTFRSVLDTRDVALRRIEMNENARAALDFIASELGSAYLTPDSLKPVLTDNVNQQTALQDQPRFRFAGIYRDLEASADFPIPGYGKDDDGDGLTDEEILDGRDGDYTGGNFNGRTQTDPLGCEEGDSACVDEDIGLFPSDLLHFVTAVENEGDIVLQEVSYGLDRTGTKLIRRGKTLRFNDNTELATLVNFGQFIDNQTGRRLLPPPTPIGQTVNTSALQNALNNWNEGATNLTLAGEQAENNAPARAFQVLAYDIRGLRFRYWYYDYNRGGWRVAREWDSSRETALMSPTEFLFTQRAMNNSSEGRMLGGFPNLIVNEAQDMYPRGAGSSLVFLETNPSRITDLPEYREVYNRISEHTDGLPNMVEITIYVQDRDRSLHPRPYTTRVYVPNNYIDIGI
jgi:prepilin-type N-terminal cleavage/methylation domain-containing protein